MFSSLLTMARCQPTFRLLSIKHSSSGGHGATTEPLLPLRLFVVLRIHRLLVIWAAWYGISKGVFGSPKKRRTKKEEESEAV